MSTDPKPLSEIIPKLKPFQFEGLDIRPSFRANDAGSHTYSVNIMVTEEQWNALKTIPRHRMLGGILYWFDDESELPASATEARAETQPEKRTEPKPPKPSKGPYGQFWNILKGKRHVDDNLDIQQVLDCGPGEVWERLHEEFQTETMATVGPRDWEAWIKAKGLPEGLITQSRIAEKQVAMQQN